jgi:DNA polymerase-1
MNITIAHEKYTVEFVEDAKVITEQLQKDKPKFITFDTETDGLHIKKSKPFLAAVAWDGKVFVFEPTRDNLYQMSNWSKMVKRIFAHNATYDMHMVANIVNELYVSYIKWGDTMCLCRLAFEAISKRDGGDSLALKEISLKYIDPNADKYERDVKAWLKSKMAMNKKVLIAMFKGIGWSLRRFQNALDGAEDVPPEAAEVLNNWNKHYPDPTYKDVPQEIMIPYLAVDVILTNILVKKSMPVVVERNQQATMTREFDLLPVVFKMERQGMRVDREYLMQANYRMEQYIQDLRILSHQLAGTAFNVGQHAVIKNIYAERLGYEPKSTDKQFLAQQAREGDDLAQVISKLRRLEKWKETYIERILEASEHDGRFYTSMNQFNPISGRFSGDAQQFPKDRIVDENGVELYHPRRAFLTTSDYMYFIDFSQIELRVQAHYTVPFGGDTNLCRAYMPFRCKHYIGGFEFDDLSTWNEKQADGKSAWLMEDGKPWTPTDVHSATAIKALEALNIVAEGAEFKKWRDIGKRFNFMRNYGGGDAKAAETLEIELEQAKAMNRGYTEAFPLVVQYQKWVESVMDQQGYMENLYGRRYYLNNPNRFYKCSNYLIQGSSADMLKERMILIDKYIVNNKLRMRMAMCIHDELIFDVPVGEEKHIQEIKKIMEHAPNIAIPIVAEVERTTTTWADKGKS